MIPQIFDSKTKTGAILTLILVVLYLWLPEFGINMTDSIIQKINITAIAVSLVLTAFGVRNAIAKVENEIYQSKLESPKKDN